MEELKAIKNRQVGVIQLNGSLDIDAVTSIFIRINSQGVPLSQADFVMSKIAANETYGGNLLRKCIDHFSHLSVKLEFSSLKANDKEFVDSEYFPAIAWLKNENEDIYDPDYTDIIRVAFLYGFSRGKLGDLVSLLSGRNFETREFEQSIEENTYKILKVAVLDFVNETNFKRFLMIISSAGFCHSKLITSDNALNFAYALYLKLRSLNYSPEKIEKFVRRWLVLSILTSRYSGSAETRFDSDIKAVEDCPIEEVLADEEEVNLSESFWSVALPQKLRSSYANNPVFNLFLAAQCKNGARGFLSKDILVKDLIEQRGDVHHVFPKEYLKQGGLGKGQYNQVANYAYVQSEINIKIGKKAPDDYLGYVLNVQCEGGQCLYGGITDIADFKKNLEENCIPFETVEMDESNYEEFLQKRRELISSRLKQYYFSL